MAVAATGSSCLKYRRLKEHTGEGGRLLKSQACSQLKMHFQNYYFIFDIKS